MEAHNIPIIIHRDYPHPLVQPRHLVPALWGIDAMVRAMPTPSLSKAAAPRHHDPTNPPETRASHSLERPPLLHVHLEGTLRGGKRLEEEEEQEEPVAVEERTRVREKKGASRGAR